mgnify:CR=1 FL=1
MKKKVWLNKRKFLWSVLLIVFGGNCFAISPTDKQTRDSLFNNLVVYQIMVEAYIDGDPKCDYNVGYGSSSHKGDLNGITKSLPYLKSLGINAIWLTPIFDSEGNEKLDATGYFCKNYFKIDPKFGTFDDAKNMVNKAHELGIYVFLDGVFGHHKKGGSVYSPNGNKTVLKSSSETAVSYPESLDFYKEVATYWIDKLEIDGWRLDQSYQLSYKGGQDKNYWKEIREAVEEKCNERIKAGKKWGTLGYMVGEDWVFEKEEAKNIQKNTYSEDGLQSAFDFPSRYQIVRLLACDSERKINFNDGVNALSYVYSTPEEKGYSHKDGIFPNLFITNHDLVRFGNLLNWRYGLTRKNKEYWDRHKCALSILAAYSGPITLYYGDEYGDMLDGYKKHGDFGYANDNVGRSNGKSQNFTSKEQDLINYTKEILKIRKTNPALFMGIRKNLLSDNELFIDYKENDDNKMIFILNIGKEKRNITLSKNDVGGNKLVDLMTGKMHTCRNDKFSFNIFGLSSAFIQVLEE